MTIQQGERIVVGTPARQRWRLAVIGIVMTGLSAALAVTRPYGDLGLVVGVLGLVFFGPLTLSLLLRAARRTPALILDGDGFTDHATLAAAGFVRWEDVHSVSEQPFAGRIFVTVTVTVADRAAFRRRLPAWRRPFLRINQHLAGGDVFIPDSVLPMPPGDLVKMMRTFRHEARNRSHGHGKTPPP
jgi:hypothetical protein